LAESIFDEFAFGIRSRLAVALDPAWPSFKLESSFQTWSQSQLRAPPQVSLRNDKDLAIIDKSIIRGVVRFWLLFFIHYSSLIGTCWRISGPCCCLE
jgi:hypothetical protein